VSALTAAVRSSLGRRVLANFSARVCALAALALATVVVARAGGPTDVGAYALLRMLPGLVGVLAAAGLPNALAFFLAAPRRDTPALWPTITAVAAAGAVIGVVAWWAVAAPVQRLFFPDDPTTTIALAGGTVATQLYLTVAKTGLQGLGDRRGADVVIAAEELAFLPCYLLVLLTGLSGTAALAVALAAADVAVGAPAWRRVRRGALAGRLLGRPDRRLTGQLVSYGTRGQLGGLITLLNLRLDFAFLGAIAGPAVLGTYAVASKYAELLRLPGTALTWVCYPQLAAAPAAEASAHARRYLRPALLTVLLPAVPAYLLTGPVMALLYGARFADAVPQARVLLAGMLLAGAAGVASAYLYARGRPGVNSLVLGVGLLLTVVLDLLLIPAHGALGAAWASTAAYLVTDALLIATTLRWTSRARAVSAGERATEAAT
jgi:O-antigen/teichoic acid export membrane protein